MAAASPRPGGSDTAQGPVADGPLVTTLMGRPPLPAAHGRTYGPPVRILFATDSTAGRLARCSPVPVLVVRGRRAAPEHVLAVVDDSAGSLPAIQLLARLPLPVRSEIVILHLGRGPAAERLERPIEQARMFLSRPHRHLFADAADVTEQIGNQARALGAD